MHRGYGTALIPTMRLPVPLIQKTASAAMRRLLQTQCENFCRKRMSSSTPVARLCPSCQKKICPKRNSGAHLGKHRDAGALSRYVLVPEDGSLFTWLANEHCLVLTGYDESSYYLNDPSGGGASVSYPKALVEARYNDFSSQALVILPAETRQAPSAHRTFLQN